MTTMEKKRVAELEGAQLDWAVAVAGGFTRARMSEVYSGEWIMPDGKQVFAPWFKPSSDWKQGGMIVGELIASGEFQIIPWHCKGDDAVNVTNTDSECMPVKFGSWTQTDISAIGKDVLTASCRAFVMWKLGEEVEVPV